MCVVLVIRRVSCGILYHYSGEVGVPGVGMLRGADVDVLGGPVDGFSFNLDCGADDAAAAGRLSVCWHTQHIAQSVDNPVGPVCRREAA